MLTLYFAMSLNGQTHFKNLAALALKVHQCRFEYLPISSPSHEKNNKSKISHQNIFLHFRICAREKVCLGKIRNNKKDKN